MLVGKPLGKSGLGRQRSTWEDELKLIFSEMVYDYGN
jgi:hypothetical protein